jgi:hypothetical protein
VNGNPGFPAEEAVGLQLEVKKRRTWFYETQLRRLNLEGFREVRPDKPGPLLELISEQPPPEVFPGQFGRPEGMARVYRDSQQPVWTADDASRHGAFGNSLIGLMGDFLNAREPRKLAERLKNLRDQYEASAFGSVMDPLGGLLQFPRTRPEPNPDDEPRTDPARPADSKAVAISRAELAAAMPWLIPELYNAAAVDAPDLRGWVTNLERYVADFESELALTVGEIGGTAMPFDLDAPATYRGLLTTMLTTVSTRPASQAVNVRLIDLAKVKPEHEEATYIYRLSIATNGSPMGPVADYRLSERVKYWSGVVNHSLKECVALKPNSDMGLCQLVRLLYRYGTLPQGMGSDGDLRWRRRVPPDEMFNRFFAERAKAAGEDAELRRRLQTAETRLRIILEETAAHPRSFDPSFSPLAGEILKQGLLSYKYWLDEKPRALENERLNKVKNDLGYADDGIDLEMEFWSENHYIMFASSEYLLGQLWQDETFQPCRLFVDAGDTTGAKTGAQRRDRGRARVLKWLNNRLMFGWMEFNSSGYYREHLWALLNLVDFALDEEVRTKATMAVDLMLFDVTRYLHRGAMGAAGGRSQFKSRSHGFDNGLTDVVEIMLGVKGVFSEGDAQVAASFASSTYQVPKVLLEIGAAPPTYPFTDRSRVSITFDESAKYGITWSQDSVTKDSLMSGYASKRARYSPFLAEVNDDIARTHDDYGAVDDDTVFFWGMSAFVNKQVVRNSFKLMHRYGLSKADAFKQPRLVMGLVSLFKDPPSQLFYAITGEPLGDIDESTADDLSLVFEGSTRTRANIVTYRSPGAMLSSIQNFRTGQLNFQSSVQQATLNGALNVFVNAGFGDIDLSEVATFGVGALAGGLVGGPWGAIIGGVAAVIGEQEALEDTNPLCPKHADGPDWWTGNWALPRMVQHGGAVIMLSEFHEIQEFLAETGSHSWFPKSGFNRVVERRTSAYDDANFALLDIGDIGPKGFWLFGKVVHPVPEGSTAEPEEGYVGVFSNQRPEWLTRESAPYDHRLEQWIEDKEDGERLLKDAPDLFTDKDWYVNGDNIWIVQIGSKTEFGSFETFMNRVSSARVHVDDAGDLECTYDVPRPEGGFDRLRLTNGDDAEFELNGRALATDLFPRFENPFVRSGIVEWGQRTYCLEWNGQTLLHDFSDGRHPVRQEAPVEKPGDAETIVALVIHLRTGDEAMEAFTIATATVDIGCQRATTEQVIAAGPVGEDAQHDAEWIFLDQPIKRSADMVLRLGHPASGGNPTDLSFLKPPEVADLNPSLLLGPLSLLGEVGSPEWQASFSLKALMGDHRLRDCVVPFAQLNFEGDRRQSGPRPFSVRLSVWADWEPVGGNVEIGSWLLARHPPHASIWSDHHDLFVIDRRGLLWHRRTTCGGTMGFWRELDATGAAPDWTSPFSWSAVSDPVGQAGVFVVSEGRLLARVADARGGWSEPWAELRPMVPGTLFPEPVPLGPGSLVTAVPGVGPFDGTDLYLAGADGEIYLRRGWTPGDLELWRRLRTVDFDLAPQSPLRVIGRQIVALSQQGELWIRDLEGMLLFGGAWQKVNSPGFAVHAFAAGGTDDKVQLAVRGPSGEVSIGEYRSGEPVHWRSTTAVGGWRPAVETDLVWAVLEPGSVWLFTSGADGTVRVLSTTDATWLDFGSGTAPRVPTRSRLEVACRTPGQVEVFTQTATGDLVWTWWS